MGHPGAAVKAQRPAGSVHGHTRPRGTRERWAFAAYAPGGLWGNGGPCGAHPRARGWRGLRPGASWERWACAAHARGKGGGGGCAPGLRGNGGLPAHPRARGPMGLRPGRFAGTVGLRSPRPRQGGRWGCAPRGPLASPGSPSISRHPGETRSTGKISKAPLAHPFGTGPAGLVPSRLSRSFVHKPSRGVTGMYDGLCSK
jgi:hypothetical protein